ncbi:hypothetical protein LZ554_006445 [Drepanopeziza brunnea f. sp. 'monogermtubi']|nr:hypothetical protein LZ554_006445 [Drepanopeziza brunnea f. sp. 'monogermtubi']
MHSIPSITTSLLLLLLLFGAAPLAWAECTEWINTRTDSDGPSSYSNAYVTPLERLACPKHHKNNNNNNTNCEIGRRSYEFTVDRALNVSVADADVDSIFALAEAAYNNNNNNNNNNNSNPPSARSSRPFASMHTTVSSHAISPLFLSVAPGETTSLGWVAFMIYSLGTLGGCANASLNGLGVRAASPYLLRGEGEGNVTAAVVVAGTFYASTQKSGGAEGGRGGGKSGVLVVGVAAIGFAFLL